MEMRGDEDDDRRQDECDDRDPEGASEICESEAEGAWALEGEDENCGECDDGGDVEDALPGVWRPDDEQDENVGEGEFECGAAASHLER